MNDKCISKRHCNDQGDVRYITQSGLDRRRMNGSGATRKGKGGKTVMWEVEN